MFSQISQNWQGQPLISRQVVVNLIRHTTTQTGLKLRAELDDASYPKGIKITDEEFNAIAIERHEFHGEWNYQINPRIGASLFNLYQVRLIAYNKSISASPRHRVCLNYGYSTGHDVIFAGALSGFNLNREESHFIAVGLELGGCHFD